MKRILILLAIVMLVACTAPIEQKEAAPEHPVEKEVAPAAEPTPMVAPTPAPEAKENESVASAEQVKDSPEVAKAPSMSVLSLAEQQKEMPSVEKAVNASDCYQLSWADIGNYTAKHPLSVERAVRYQYVSGLKWKAWITLRLYYARKIIDTESVGLVVDDGKVTCSQTEPFAIDWTDALERVSHR